MSKSPDASVRRPRVCLCVGVYERECVYVYVCMCVCVSVCVGLHVRTRGTLCHPLCVWRVFGANLVCVALRRRMWGCRQHPSRTSSSAWYAWAATAPGPTHTRMTSAGRPALLLLRACAGANGRFRCGFIACYWYG